MLHHIEIRSRLSCSVFFEFAQCFSLLYEVWCHPLAYDILQLVMVYAEVDHEYRCRRVQVFSLLLLLFLVVVVFLVVV